MNPATRENIMEDFIEVDELNSDQFLRVKETLTRIGAAMKAQNENEKPTLWQSVHILHSKGRYFLVHFKQMFLLDGRSNKTVITDDDIDRLDAIAALLDHWGLVTCKLEPRRPDIRVKVIPYAEKDGWQLKPKYNLGKRDKVKQGNGQNDE